MHTVSDRCRLHAAYYPDRRSQIIISLRVWPVDADPGHLAAVKLTLAALGCEGVTSAAVSGMHAWIKDHAALHACYQMVVASCTF